MTTPQEIKSKLRQLFTEAEALVGELHTACLNEERSRIIRQLAQPGIETVDPFDAESPDGSGTTCAPTQTTESPAAPKRRAPRRVSAGEPNDEETKLITHAIRNGYYKKSEIAEFSGIDPSRCFVLLKQLEQAGKVLVSGKRWRLPEA